MITEEVLAAAFRKLRDGKWELCPHCGGNPVQHADGKTFLCSGCGMQGVIWRPAP